MGDHIGSGGMGAIHAAFWRGRPVAVKRLHDATSDQLAAIQSELMVHATLRHPNVVELLGASFLGSADDCIVMERCECSLFQRLHVQKEELDRRAALAIAIDIAEAMAFLHSRSPPDSCGAPRPQEPQRAARHRVAGQAV